MVDEKEFALPHGSFLFPRVFEAFRLAVRPSQLALAFAAVTIIGLAGWIMDLSRTVIVVGDYKVPRPRADLRWNQNASELNIYLMGGALALEAFIESRQTIAERTGVFGTLWQFGAAQSRRTLSEGAGLGRGISDSVRALCWALRWHTVYSIVFLSVALVTLAWAGGAMSRMAALQFARAERLGLLRAARFGRRRLGSLVGALVGPLAIITVFGLPAVLFGLIGNVPVVGEVLTGLLLPLALLAACAATVVLVGAIGGLSLMAPAVAYENSDSFDAISRSFIVYRDPWRTGFYAFLAVVYGAICYLFVRLFAFLLLWTTRSFLQVGFLGRHEKLQALWPAPMFARFLDPAAALPDTWSMWIAAVLMRFWVCAVIALVAAFVLSFYFSASTIVYALLRQSVDGTPLSDIYVSPSESSLEARPSESVPDTGVAASALETNGTAEPGPRPST
ncbi:MAG: hypothetical protein MUC88_03660 [Planctomycetes bacterium]|jgi:hypothetical protein|nr:hypothetical protein [Planctomycetota bacterium]